METRYRHELVIGGRGLCCEPAGVEWRADCDFYAPPAGRSRLKPILSVASFYDVRKNQVEANDLHGKVIDV